MIAFTVPVRTVSEANAHQHWRERQRRAKEHRHTASWMARAALAKAVSIVWPAKVTMTRVSPRELDDDNLAGALKHVRDGIADALGMNDRDPRIHWAVAQRQDSGGYSVEVTIE